MEFLYYGYVLEFKQKTGQYTVIGFNFTGLVFYDTPNAHLHKYFKVTIKCNFLRHVCF